MTVRYTLREPGLRGYIPPDGFGLYGTGHYIHTIFRLLLGSVNAFDRVTGKLEILNWDESRFALSNRSAKPSKVTDILFEPSENISVENYLNFLRNYHPRNEAFFETFSRELTHCIVAKKRQCLSEAFLHFYRILEYVSLSFPAVYSRAQSDFERSFEFHKGLFRGMRDTDLVALQTFSDLLGQAGGISSLSYDLDYNDVGALNGRACLDELKASLHKSLSDQNTDVPNLKIELSFTEMPKFLVELRNRLFHFTYGERNIRVCNAGGTDVLLAPVMQVSLNWLFQLYSEIIRTLSKDYISRVS